MTCGRNGVRHTGKRGRVGEFKKKETQIDAADARLALAVRARECVLVGAAQWEHLDFSSELRLGALQLEPRGRRRRLDDP